MAFLEKGKKADLIELCESLGIELPDNANVDQIKNEIISHESYRCEEIFIATLFDTIVKERLEFEERESKRQLESGEKEREREMKFNLEKEQIEIKLKREEEERNIRLQREQEMFEFEKEKKLKIIQLKEQEMKLKFDLEKVAVSIRGTPDAEEHTEFPTLHTSFFQNSFSIQGTPSAKGQLEIPTLLTDPSEKSVSIRSDSDNVGKSGVPILENKFSGNVVGIQDVPDTMEKLEIPNSGNRAFGDKISVQEIPDTEGQIIIPNLKEKALGMQPAQIDKEKFVEFFPMENVDMIQTRSRTERLNKERVEKEKLSKSLALRRREERDAAGIRSFSDALEVPTLRADPFRASENEFSVQIESDTEGLSKIPSLEARALVNEFSVQIESDTEGQMQIPDLQERASELKLLQISKEKFMEAQRKCEDLAEIFRQVDDSNSADKTYSISGGLLVKNREDPVIREIFSKLNIDICGPLPKTTDENRYIITAICMSSRYPEAIPVTIINSVTAIDALLNIFSRTGFPHENQYDQGSYFTRGVDRNKFIMLGDINCKMKLIINGYFTWPQNIRSKCQFNILTLDKQNCYVARMELENSSTSKKFLEYLRLIGIQKFIILYEYSEVYKDEFKNESVHTRASDPDYHFEKEIQTVGTVYDSLRKVICNVTNIISKILHDRLKIIHNMNLRYICIGYILDNIGKLTPLKFQSILNGFENLKQFVRKSIQNVVKKRALCLESGDQWDKHLPIILLALLTVTHESIGFTIAGLVYGRNLRTPEALIAQFWFEPQEGNEIVTEYELINRLKRFCVPRAQDIAFSRVEEMQAKRKKWYDKNSVKRELKEGDLVLVLATSCPNKVSVQWIGAESIQSKISETNYLVEIPGKKDRTQIYHVNMLKPYHIRPELINLLICDEGMERACDEDLDIPYIENGPTVYDFRKIVQNSNLKEVLKDIKIDQLRDLLNKYVRCFSNEPGLTNLVEHDIVLISDKYFRYRPYRTSLRQKETLNSEIQRILKLGIVDIGEIYTSPMILVEVPGKDPRPCIGYQKINHLIKTEYFPLPNIQERVKQVSIDNYITVIYPAKGYWQIVLSEGAKRYAAFVRPSERINQLE